MKNQHKLKSFYDSLEDIDITNTKLDKKRDELSQIIHGFNKQIQKYSIDKNLKVNNEQILMLLNQTMEQLKSSSNIWVEDFHKLLEREKFRSDLENYFIVIIFGKVKAGKSSLGNFIAKNNTSIHKAIFFKYDEAGNEQEIKELQEIQGDNEFATNNLECTSSIQGFKLNSLAWIDTPGLGSMTKQNGDLAKQYIQSADYIIYPTSSNSPLQQDEIAQINELFLQNKSVSICITKSDTLERRKDDNGKYIKNENGKIAKFLTNKSIENRNQQVKYVKEEIEKLDKNKDFKIGDIFSLSAHAAQKGLDTNDEDLFENSNITQFYELLTQVVKQKASKLKTQAPYHSLISFIDNELLSKTSDYSLDSLLNAFNAFDKKIEETKDKLEQIKSNTKSDIQTQIEYIVSKHISDVDKNGSQGIFGIFGTLDLNSWVSDKTGDKIQSKPKNSFETMDEEIAQSIQKLVNDNIKEIFADFSTSLNELQNKLVPSSDFKIKDEYKTIKVWYEDNSLFNKIVKVITLGTCGKNGEYLEEEVKVGNNKDEVLRKFKTSRSDAYVKFTLNTYSEVSKNFFNSIQNVSTNMQNSIKNLETSVLSFKNNLEKE